MNHIKKIIFDILSSDPFIFDLIENDGDFSKINHYDSFVIIDYYDLILKTQYLVNGTYLNFYEMIDFFKMNNYSDFIKGIESFFRYRENIVEQVLTIRTSDDIIKDVLKNQMINIIKDKKLQSKFEVIGMAITTKDRDLIQKWFICAKELFLKNCFNVSYMNNFILNGLTDAELSTVDALI